MREDHLQMTCVRTRLLGRVRTGSAVINRKILMDQNRHWWHILLSERTLGSDGEDRATGPSHIWRRSSRQTCTVFVTLCV